MPFRIITVPFEAEKECFLEEELNKFCLSRKVKSWKSEFFTHGAKAFWTVFLEYEEVLSNDKRPESFSDAENLLYQRLKEWRKEKAEKAGVPVFIIANNGELAELVRKAPRSIEALKGVRGFGRKKIERYGKELIDLVTALYDARPRGNPPLHPSQEGTLNGNPPVAPSSEGTLRTRE